MSVPYDICGRAQEVRLLIAEDHVGEAIHRLMDFVRDFSDEKDNLNEVIVLSAGYRRIEKATRRGQLGFGDAERQRDKLLYQILGLVDAIEEEPRLAHAS